MPPTCPDPAGLDRRSRFVMHAHGAMRAGLREPARQGATVDKNDGGFEEEPDSCKEKEDGQQPFE